MSTCAYYCEIDPTAKWSNKKAIPAIGTKVNINFNGLGNGEVAGYFKEHGFMGCIVKLYNAPAWHKKQSKGTKYEGYALVFGNELEY